MIKHELALIITYYGIVLVGVYFLYTSVFLLFFFSEKILKVQVLSGRIILSLPES